jgi:hypothetical protein
LGWEAIDSHIEGRLIWRCVEREKGQCSEAGWHTPPVVIRSTTLFRGRIQLLLKSYTIGKKYRKNLSNRQTHFNTVLCFCRQWIRAIMKNMGFIFLSVCTRHQGRKIKVT